jgi:hypothetical protein
MRILKQDWYAVPDRIFPAPTLEDFIANAKPRTSHRAADDAEQRLIHAEVAPR